MFDKMKTELNAALAISTGVLLASGYLVTYLRFANERLPTEGVLSALPDSFYLGVALENLVPPMAVLITLGLAWVVAAVLNGPSDNVPGNVFWFGFGAGLSIWAWVVVSSASPFPLPNNQAYVLAAIVCGTGGTVATMALGGLARWRLRSVTDANQGDQLLAGGGAVLLSCVGVSVAFLGVDVRFKDRAFPEAAVFTDRDDCAEEAAAKRRDPGCGLAGFYIGEGDTWLYLLEDTRASTPTLEAEDPNLPGRLLFIPRGNVRQVRLDVTLSDVPAGAMRRSADSPRVP